MTTIKKKITTTQKSATTKRTSAAERRAEAASRIGLSMDRYFAVAREKGGQVEIINGQILVRDTLGNLLSATTRGTSKVSVPDAIQQQIIQGGHIENAAFHRRWVMAQMFRIIDCANGRSADEVTNHVRSLGLRYMFKMLTEEVHVLARMERNGSDQFAVRSRFFSIETVGKILHTVYQDFDLGFVSLVLREKIQSATAVAQMSTSSFAALERLLRDLAQFYRKASPVKFRTTNAPSLFAEIYKANGAYYTMQNMIMFHDCKWRDENGSMLDQYGSIRKLNAYLDGITNMCLDCNKLFDALIALIKDNQFDFGRRMNEVYAQRNTQA